MGKKRIVTTAGGAQRQTGESPGDLKLAKKRISSGRVYIQATYNNTLMAITDPDGNIITWSSSGALGFKGTKKGTPFAAGRLGELMAEKAAGLGLKEVEVYISGVGSGRESAVRSFASRSGAIISVIRDVTPLPHNGPRPPKPRRV